MTRLATILITNLLLICGSLVVRAQVYTVQTSPDLIAWQDSSCRITNSGEPAKFIRLVEGVRVSWTAVSNAVSYTVWMPAKFIRTTNCFTYIQPGTYFITARDAAGNDSNPSEVYQL